MGRLNNKHHRTLDFPKQARGRLYCVYSLSSFCQHIWDGIGGKYHVWCSMIAFHCTPQDKQTVLHELRDYLYSCAASGFGRRRAETRYNLRNIWSQSTATPKPASVLRLPDESKNLRLSATLKIKTKQKIYTTKEQGTHLSIIHHVTKHRKNTKEARINMNDCVRGMLRILRANFGRTRADSRRKTWWERFDAMNRKKTKLT